jgi:hypothetical protein
MRSRHLVINALHAPTAGDLMALGRGDTLLISRSAVSRKDWAGLWVAIMTAYTRGARLIFEES